MDSTERIQTKVPPNMIPDEITFDPHIVANVSGDNDRLVSHDHILRILSDVLRSATYQSHPGRVAEAPNTLTRFSENADYWRHASTKPIFHGLPVLLQDFWVSEWAPFSPGRFFAAEARDNRRRARQYLNERYNEYHPLGKSYMILGGIGSLRLSPKVIGKQEIFVLGASSSGVSHEGIPITCEADIYKHVIQDIKQAGAVKCNVRGCFRHLPDQLQNLRFGEKVEKYCVHVTHVDIVDVATARDLLCTVQILFPSHYSTYKEDDSLEFFTGNGYRTRLEKSWAFASFRPGMERYGDQRTLSDAVEWLKGYVSRYGDGDLPILNDFDESQNHFSNPVEFPISVVKEGSIDFARLDAYQRYFGPIVYAAKMEVRMGDTFENISGSTIINRSVVQESLNALREGDRELASAFEQLARAVEAANNAAATATYEQLVAEAAQRSPDKGRLQQLWDGLVTLAPGVGTLAEAAAKVTSLFS